MTGELSEEVKQNKIFQLSCIYTYILCLPHLDRTSLFTLCFHLHEIFASNIFTFVKFCCFFEKCEVSRKFLKESWSLFNFRQEVKFVQKSERIFDTTHNLVHRRVTVFTTFSLETAVEKTNVLTFGYSWPIEMDMKFEAGSCSWAKVKESQI